MFNIWGNLPGLLGGWENEAEKIENEIKVVNQKNVTKFSRLCWKTI
jgi:hypothetical protein